MSAITVLKDNVPTGPFTREQIAQKLQAGEMTLEDWAFIEGLSQWTPLRDVLAKADAAMTPPVPPAPPVPIASAPAYSYAATMQPPEHVRYAGFWLRVAAIFIDGLILSPLAIGSYVLQMMVKSATDRSVLLGMAIVSMLYGLACLVLRWLYFALFESSWQATPGKWLLSIKVTDLRGQKIGFGRATGRFFGKLLSALTLMIGFAMAGFTERKQALHDMIAGTLVVRK